MGLSKMLPFLCQIGDFLSDLISYLKGLESFVESIAKCVPDKQTNKQTDRQEHAFILLIQFLAMLKVSSF